MFHKSFFLELFLAKKLTLFEREVYFEKKSSIHVFVLNGGLLCFCAGIAERL